jgi:hypothetical protein
MSNSTKMNRDILQARQAVADCDNNMKCFRTYLVYI